jgi:hypothetical protein
MGNGISGKNGTSSITTLEKRWFSGIYRGIKLSYYQLVTSTY